MATPFSAIYEKAMFKFRDYEFLKIESELRNIILHNYLVSAQTEFQHYCDVDLSSRNDEEECYDADLDDRIIEILSLGIAYYWISANTLDSDRLHNRLNTKDYTTYSPANLIDKMNELRNETEKDFRQAIRRYTYQTGDLSNPLG